MCMGCRPNQEHLLVLPVQTLSREARPEKSHHCGGTYPHRHWLLPAEKAEQLQRAWRKLFRPSPLRRVKALLGQTAPATRPQGNSGADGSCLTLFFPHGFGFRGKRPVSRGMRYAPNVSTCSKHKE